VTLYVLDLAEDNYYVGISNRPLTRFEEHLTRMQGAEWTREYPPLRVREARVVPAATCWADEDAETLRQMRIYGVDNVQGGHYTGPDGARLARARLALEAGPPRPAPTKPAGPSPILLTFKALDQAMGGAE
jgi:hypothetical protein